jgi:hypothetical protein
MFLVYKSQVVTKLLFTSDYWIIMASKCCSPFLPIFLESHKRRGREDIMVSTHDTFGQLSATKESLVANSFPKRSLTIDEEGNLLVDFSMAHIIQRPVFGK